MRWGTNVLDRLQLRGDERVLDAGCGSGRVTELLLERLPAGCVVALDASQHMLEAAAQRLAPYGDRVALLQANLARPLPLDAPVDAILSTATFHWVRDHDALFRNLAAVLQPGGQLVAQCGGAGNIASIVSILDELGYEALDPWHFAAPEATRHRLEGAGFEDIAVWLNDEPTPLPPGQVLETFLRTVILGAHLDALSPDEGDQLVHDVAAQLPDPAHPVIDYVRLNIVARRVQ